MLVTTTPSDLPAPLRLTAGVVAYNEELSLEGALHSLLTQELPPGASWDAVWVVASGCTDGTVEVARRVMAGDARVHLVVEEERRGKTRAMQQVFEKATGDALVLLNADARAEAGAIASLLEVAPWGAPPWAVMARPVIRDERTGPWAGAIRSMWEVHNRFHGLLQEEGGGGHLSDELLLLSLPNHPQLPEGIIGDGSYLGVWLEQNGGRWRYAENARVTIQIPHALKDH
ncbi:MAG TPA: glycosyltransferase, partial [Thermoplasmata archaeon]|nr:glycosyltransferase [Thermoplasmata archaeon]